MEKLIARARRVLIFLEPKDACAHLINKGEEPGQAFLAVKAAEILCQGSWTFLQKELSR
jgi:hypothetical protein